MKKVQLLLLSIVCLAGAAAFFLPASFLSPSACVTADALRAEIAKIPACQDKAKHFDPKRSETLLRAKDVPREQLTKGLTLGASHHEISLRIVLPQILPAVLNTIRLNFKAMILFLIAGESLAATVGLGYRIFVVRRYMAMDIIIPYVVWMSLLAVGADLLVRFYIRKRYPWSLVNK